MKVFVHVCVLVMAGSLVWADPVLLDKDSFAETVDSGKPVFVKFFAPWCGHCKRLAPTWDELAEKFFGSDLATIAKVDCTVERELCSDNGVRGYPTLKLFLGAGEEPVAYQGSRDLDSLFQFVMDKASPDNSEASPSAEKTGEEGEGESEEKEEGMPGGATAVEVVRDEQGVVHLTDQNFNSYISTKEGILFVKFYAPWCGHCKRLAPTWDQLAGRYHDNNMVEVVKVDCTAEKATCQRYEVKGYPTLLLLADGLVLHKYTGSRTLDDLAQFLEDNRLDI